MKIGKLLKSLPTILKMSGMGNVDIKEQLNSLPNALVDLINKSEQDIEQGLSPAIFSVKSPDNELILIPIGYDTKTGEVVIKQELKAINVTEIIKETDLTKLADQFDDKNSNTSFIEKLKLSKID